MCRRRYEQLRRGLRGLPLSDRPFLEGLGVFAFLCLLLFILRLMLRLRRHTLIWGTNFFRTTYFPSFPLRNRTNKNWGFSDAGVNARGNARGGRLHIRQLLVNSGCVVAFGQHFRLPLLLQMEKRWVLLMIGLALHQLQLAFLRHVYPLCLGLQDGRNCRYHLPLHAR
jgi:hypothetical protein